MSVADAIANAPQEVREPIRPERPRLAPVPFNEIELTTSPPYLVKGLIPRGGLTVVWGPPKCGKSYWVFDVAMHVALGWDYRDRRVYQGPAVYIACEGANGFRARVEAFRQRHLSEQSGSVPFFLIPATLDLVGDADELIDQIKSTLPGRAMSALGGKADSGGSPWNVRF